MTDAEMKLRADLTKWEKALMEAKASCKLGPALRAKGFVDRHKAALEE